MYKEQKGGIKEMTKREVRIEVVMGATKDGELYIESKGERGEASKGEVIGLFIETFSGVIAEEVQKGKIKLGMVKTLTGMVEAAIEARLRSMN